MFDQILVPLDGTPQSAAALPLARTLANACRAQVVLIRVTPTPVERDSASRYLERIALELETSDITLTTEVCSGVDVGSQLLWAIRDRHIGLVVMATHGRSGFQRAVMGSVAELLVRESPVPVLLVRPGGHRTTALRTLLVTVDGTPGAALAVGHATALARATGARVVLLEVASPTPLWMYSAQLAGPTYVPVDLGLDDDALSSARRYVETLAKHLRQSGIAAEGRALVGEVVPTIEAVADEIDADLIVMATHARAGVARAVLGSTADAVVRTAQRPVLLVRLDTRGQPESRVAELATPAQGGPDS